jgi:hypothetical protein
VISAHILPREPELSLEHAQRCSFLIMEHSSGPMAVEMVPGNTAISTIILPRKRELSVAHARRFSFLNMEQCSGPLTVEIFKKSTSISALILPSDRELSLFRAQRCSFLITEQSCGPLAVEFAQRKNCDFSSYLPKGARAQSGACADVQSADYGTELWSPGSKNNSRKELRFQHLSYQESESSVWWIRRGAVS